jgi:hypothetical protein
MRGTCALSTVSRLKARAFLLEWLFFCRLSIPQIHFMILKGQWQRRGSKKNFKLTAGAW